MKHFILAAALCITTIPALAQSHPLLPGVIGWELTSTKNQTLDSTGTVSNGPYDLGNDSGVTFSSDGALFNGVDQVLYHSASGLRMGTDVMFLSAEVNVTGFGDYGFTYLIANTSDVNVDPFSLAASFTYYLQAEDQNGEVLGFNPFAINTTHIVFFWIDDLSGGTCTFHMQVDNGDELSSSGVPVPAESDWLSIGAGYYIGGVYDVPSQSVIRRVRLWPFADAPKAARTWLYNGGAGRTDAEVAAYTG